jgi:phage terminase small subunit
MLQVAGMTPRAPKPLSVRHQAFADKILSGASATQAYADVYGCTTKAAGANGAKLLKNAGIAAYLSEKSAIASEKAGVTVSYVIENLAEVVERCMERAPVMVRAADGKGWEQKQDDEGRDVWQFDSRGATGALKILAQHLGMLADSIRAARERAKPR